MCVDLGKLRSALGTSLTSLDIGYSMIYTLDDDGEMIDVVPFEKNMLRGLTALTSLKSEGIAADYDDIRAAFPNLTILY
jgi:hypothetical protein